MGSRTTTRAALSRALVLVERLRRSLPGKVGQLLTCSDQIRESWTDCDLSQFPLNLLLEELDALESEVRTEYEDLEQPVDRRSSVFELLIGFEHRLRFSLEFVTVSRVFQDVEARFKRIDEVLPVQNYALRSLVSLLEERYIPTTIRHNLEAGILYFDREEYQTALQRCCEAGEALFGEFRRHLRTRGFGGASTQVGPSLSEMRTWLGHAESRDSEGVAFASHDRLEWFLLSLFETLHYLRNAVNHAPEVERKLPRWQIERRAAYRAKPECARLGLCVSLQIAFELQAVLDRGAAS